MNSVKKGGGATGSRFSSLDIEDTGEDMETEDLNQDEVETAGGVKEVEAQPKGPGFSKLTELEKQRLDDEVVIACSHPSMVEGLKVSKTQEQEVGRSSTPMSQRTSKDRILKDLTNKLEPKPIKLKPSRAGSKTVSGINVREAGFVKEWIALGPRGTGLGGDNESMDVGGPNPDRPPDPGRQINTSVVPESSNTKPPEGIQSRASSDVAASMGARRSETGGDVVAAPPGASRSEKGGEDVAMEEAPAGETSNNSNQ